MRRILLLPVMALAACNPAPVNQPAVGGTQTATIGTNVGADVSVRTSVTPVSSTLPFPVDRVWEALPVAYSRMGIAVVNTDAAAHSLGNPDWRVHSRMNGKAPSVYLNCGSNGVGTPLADIYSLRLNIHSQVSATPDGSRITTTIDGWARNVTGSLQDPVHCSSNGEFEHVLATAALTSVQ